MSNTEVGCYIKLLCFCWDRGSIPNDVNKIARLCNESKENMAQLWIAIEPCFKNGNTKRRLINPRLDKERKKQIEFKEERMASGKKGAEIRWKDKDSSAITQPMAKNGSAVCGLQSSSASPKKSLKENIKNPRSKNSNPSPKKKTNSELENEFEEFWKGYRSIGDPKNSIGDKGDAKKAFRALRKKISKERLLRAFHGEADYLKYERMNNSFNKRKKFASTWLRSNRWEEHEDFEYKARL